MAAESVPFGLKRRDSPSASGKGLEWGPGTLRKAMTPTPYPSPEGEGLD